MREGLCDNTLHSKPPSQTLGNLEHRATSFSVITMSHHHVTCAQRAMDKIVAKGGELGSLQGKAELAFVAGCVQGETVFPSSWC